MSLLSREAGGVRRVAFGAAVIAAMSVALAGASRLQPPASRLLRVCADPNNLPYSNEKKEGFENKLADVLAADLGARVEYTWWSQRRGFIRNTLNAGTCDVVMGVPTGLDMVLRTQPYYRSTYEFVTRADFGPEIRTFDDPRLEHLRIGVQMIGDDGANSPPAHALARRGIVDNVRGFMVYGDYQTAMPLEPILRAVADREIDVAVVWGPPAGFYAKRRAPALRLTPVSPQIELPFMPFVFDMAMGVRRGDSTLRARLDSALVRRRADVERVLDEYGIPRVAATRRSS